KTRSENRAVRSAQPFDRVVSRVAPMDRQLPLEETVLRDDVIVEEQQHLACGRGDRGVPRRRRTALRPLDDLEREGRPQAREHLGRAVRCAVYRDDDLETDPGPMLPVECREEPAQPRATVVGRYDDANGRVVGGSHARLWSGGGIEGGCS